MALRILLIDDNPDDRALVQRELRQEFGDLSTTEVIDAGSFASAVDAAAFDLVVTDYQLCWTDGLQVLSAIKERRADVAVIMFTGTGNEDVAVEAMKKGVDEYVVKSPQRFALLRLAARSAMEKARARHALAEAEARYRELFMSAPVGLFRVTPQLGLNDANPAFLSMFGLESVEELRAPWAQKLFFAGDFDRDTWTRSVDASGEAVLTRQRPALRRDGRPFWIEENVRALQDIRRVTVAFDGAALDITARKESENVLMAAKEQAETAGRVKTAFLATMSHELRTPLNAVIGFSELLQLQTLGPLGAPRYAEYVKDIHDSASHLLSLVNSLLEMTSLETGRRALSEQLVSTRALIEEALSIVRLAASDQKVTLIAQLQPGLPNIRGDLLALRQALLNLLSNAIKFTKSNGEIRVSADLRSNGALVIGVQDNGIGIEPRDIPQILSGLTRVKDPYVRGGQGAGLGLPITKSLIELHGGQLTIDSRLGGGTNVQIILPASRVLAVTVG